MRRNANARRSIIGALGCLVAGLLFLPADVPAQTPIAAIDAVVGTWQGMVSAPAGQAPVTWNIKADGSYDGVIEGFAALAGAMKVENGKLLWKSSLTGRTGSFALQGEGDQRMLKGGVDGDAATTFELRPKK